MLHAQLTTADLPCFERSAVSRREPRLKYCGVKETIVSRVFKFFIKVDRNNFSRAAVGAYLISVGGERDQTGGREGRHAVHVDQVLSDV